MNVVSKATFDFLKQLKRNNNRDWFLENRTVYNGSRAQFTDFVTRIITEIARFDSSVQRVQAKDCLFRIFRDVRFSRDKTPYKTHFGAEISSRGRKSGYAGYYIHIEPGGKSMYAGGLHGCDSGQLKKIREHIAKNGKGFRKILAAPAFKKLYSELWDDRLKTVPRGFAKDDPNVDLLRYKSFVVSREVTDKDVLTDKFLKKAVQGFKILKPLNDYLNKAISSR